MDDNEIQKLDSRYCSYGDTVHYAIPPKIFSSCDGSFLFDDKGTPYLDFQMWYSAVNFGYKNPRLMKAMAKQMETMPQLASQYLHETKVQLAETICKNMKERTGLDGRVQFNVGGAQSNEDALKLVRDLTKKTLMFAFMGGYHGRTVAMNSITSSYRYRRPFGHASDRASFQPYPYCFRCPYAKQPDSCGLYCATQFGKLFETEYASYWDPKVNECEFPAFFMEIIQGVGGYMIPPKGYFEKMQEILRERNILLVADEIHVGMYRTGKCWAFEHYNVTPDIVTFGKSLTNGLNPLAGFWARGDLITPEKFPPGTTHSTFSSNPLGTAVGLEVFKMTQEVDYETPTMAKGEYFLKKLKELQKKWKMIGNVDGLGLTLRLELCQEDGYAPNRELTHKIFNEGLKGNLNIDGKNYGLVLDIGGYYKNVFTFSPNLEITYEEIDLGMKLLDQLLDRCGAK